MAEIIELKSLIDNYSSLADNSLSVSSLITKSFCLNSKLYTDEWMDWSETHETF